MRKIIGFDNYLITETGEVFSNNRHKFICKWVDNTGYYQVKLSKNGKWYYRRVHRLVAEAFVENTKPDLYLMVNHKDSNKLNNSYENLEWVTNQMNTQHGYDTKVYSSTYKVPVNVYDKQGNFIREFRSIRELSTSLSLNRKTVTSILKGEKSTNNYPYEFEYKK